MILNYHQDNNFHASNLKPKTQITSKKEKKNLQSSFTINQKLKLTLFHKSSIKQPDQGKLTQYNESQDNQKLKIS
jgi:hypothetical protein